MPALALSASFLVACADFRPIATKAPNEGRLRERISELHNALGNDDIAAWYAMTSPAIKERITFEQFKKNLRRDADSEPRNKAIMQAGLSKVCRSLICASFGAYWSPMSQSSGQVKNL